MDRMVPVLFARKDSIYKDLNCDVFDIDRDARSFTGNQPGIYHPPCRAWGKLKKFAKPRPDEKQLAIWSIEMIRKNGGVLEHPRHSGLWAEMNLPKGNETDEYGGFSISIDQFWFGHKAQKETLLYIVGVDRNDLPDIPIRFDRIDHVVRYSKSQWRHRKNFGKRSVNEISKSEREKTPEALANWLIDLVKLIKYNRPIPSV